MCAWYQCVPALQQFNSLKEHIKLRWKEDELIYQLKTEIDIAPFGDKVKQWIWKEHNQINKTIQECQTCRKKKAGISSLRHHMGWEDCDQLCLQLLIRYTYWIEISTKLWNWICIIMNCSNNNKPKEDQHTHEMCSHNLKIIKTNRNQETIEQMLNMQWEEADHNVHEHTRFPRSPTFRMYGVCVFVCVCATLCKNLQHFATLCNTLQHSATLCNTLQHFAKLMMMRCALIL